MFVRPLTLLDFFIALVMLSIGCVSACLRHQRNLQRWQFGANEDDGEVAVANGGWHGREP